ncbi:N-acetyltransferase [Mycobacterium sp. MFM001]|uniref:GNAT family N-acetyltransferase n=1 Tax=Mycobacterium sp. MFM001 TaxID=2049453 RepID=UPI000DA4AD53|nr:GNAT family N-acetyltransferase [Mycobacterium sp. MFM001]GBE67198.1 N-acetyltransferase [Mycobacterium sp. MFM001]
MEVRLHDSLDDFRAAAEAMYHRDPVIFTVELTLLNGARRPIDPLLLTVWEGSKPCGAAMQTPPYPLLCSGLGEESIDATVTELARVRPELVGVRGIRSTAMQFAQVWQKATGRVGTITTEERLHKLGVLRPPVGVGGMHRAATGDDDDLLDRWLDDFHAEALGNTPRGPRGKASALLWSVDGAPVSTAMVTAPAAGTARIGPVYTPPAHRGNGYGSAITAAAARWALDVGAADVVLFTDLANPVSNAIYRRIGFEPVSDSVRIDFGPRM